MIIWAASRIIPKYGKSPYNENEGIKLHSTYKLPIMYFENKEDCITFMLRQEEKLVLEKISVFEEKDCTY